MDATCISNILEEIKAKSEYCLKNNAYARVLISRVSENLIEDSLSKEGYYITELDKGCKGDIGIIIHDHLEPLKNILLGKLQENERLKTLNERLQISCQLKSQKIKDITKSISLKTQQLQNAKKISSYKDKVGRCNVEIQKLKKQLSLENMKLQNERVKVSRLEVVNQINKDKFNEEKNQNVSAHKNSKGCDQRIKEPKPSLEKLDEVYLKKTLKMIKLGIPDINDETLDVPENLDSDPDDKYLSESPKKSPDVNS